MAGEGEAPAPGGHTSERARLAEALGRAGDDLRAVVIAGEPGTGKTALLAEFVRMARDRGFAVWSGLPADVSRASSGPSGDALDEEVLASGTVIILDDLHEAGEAAELVDLLRRAGRGRVPLRAAYRDREVSPRLHSVLAQAADEGRAAYRPPEALSPDEGGASYRPMGPLSPAEARELLDAVSTTAGLVARAAAVVGERFEPELVADVAELDEDRVLTVLDELVEHDIVRPVENSRQFAFRHALVHRAAYDTAGPGWRVAAHGRAADALARRGAGALLQAPHVARAARLGDLDAVTLLTDAARALGPRAPAIAARWLHTALRLLPLDPPAPGRLDIMVDLAGALSMAGQLQESRALLHAALRLLPKGSGPAREKAVSLCGQVEGLLGQHRHARALLRDELRHLPGGVATPALNLQIACEQMADGEVATVRDWAGKAFALAQQDGKPPLQAAAAGLLALAGASAGDSATAGRWLARAVRLVDAFVDDEIADRVDAMIWVAWAELTTDRTGHALRHLDRALSVLRQTGQDVMLPHVLIPRIVALRWLGRLGEAERCGEEAAEAARHAGSDDLRDLVGLARRWVALWTGGQPGAADRAPSEPVTGWYRSLSARMLAELRLADGDADGCLALANALGGPDLPAAGAWPRMCCYEILTRAELARGRPPAAASWADRAAVLAGGLGLSGGAGLARLAHAQVLAGTDPHACAAAARAAVAAFEAAGSAVEAARARLVLGTALAAAGDHQQATAELAAAQRTFDSCGALALSRSALRQRRRLAGRSPRSSADGQAAGISGLTRREHQVAVLVSQGLTNRQAARRLSISEKTVEMHLSRVFAKLGVHSRTAVATMITRGPGSDDQ